MIPPYWEDPELYSEIQKIHNQLEKKGVVFNSQFLNDQLRIGNLIWDKQTQCVRLKPSYDFTGLSNLDVRSHREKITSLLRKEGYRFDDFLYGYLKTGETGGMMISEFMQS